MYGFVENDGVQLGVVSAGTDQKMWGRIADAIKDEAKLYLISQTTIDGKKFADNACCISKTHDRIVLAKESKNHAMAEDGLDKNGVPKWKDQSEPFEVVLWHELVGHGILGFEHEIGPTNTATTNPTGASKDGKVPDPTIAIENEAREKLSKALNKKIPLRRPTYYDKTRPEARKAKSKHAK